ncbi:MAG: hypothetical protein AAFY84_00835 [Pseudomonadota bacterium]
MILRRITKHVKDQNWFAVALDFCIVVFGVVIGIQVANWNEERSDRVDTNRTLELIIPYVEASEISADSFKTYCATTRAYGEDALLGWSDENAISDSAFLIAAYQASQIMGVRGDVGVWAQLVGAENIRNIEDLELQQLLSTYLASPSNVTLDSDVDTPYRQNVRRVIPFEIQERIRSDCGDQRIDIDGGIFVLPPECDIDFPAELAQPAAMELRARLDLRDDLQWHLASAQSTLFDLETELSRNRRLLDAIEAYLK